MSTAYLVVAEAVGGASWLCHVADSLEDATDAADAVRAVADEHRESDAPDAEAVQASRVWILAWGWRAGAVVVQAGWDKEHPDAPWKPARLGVVPSWPVTPDTRGAWSQGWA